MPVRIQMSGDLRVCEYGERQSSLELFGRLSDKRYRRRAVRTSWKDGDGG